MPVCFRKTPASPRRRGFTLIEIMVVMLVLGILLTIAMPSFVSARESGRAKACIANLYQINSAKLQCMMDNKLSTASTATFSVDGVTATTPGPNGNYQLTFASSSPNYIRTPPTCPSGGDYAPGGVNTLPTCSIATNPGAATDYQLGGKWYHGY